MVKMGSISRATYSLALLLGSWALLGLTGCKGTGPGPDPVDFDQGAMLQFVGEEIIIPTYTALATHTAALQGAVATLTAEPTEAHLAAAQAALYEAWYHWQYASPYEVGPAEDVLLRSHVNIYPTDGQQIENNVLTNDYDLEAASNLDAKGFPALDYLLHGTDAATTLAALAEANRASYLQAVATDLNTKVQAVLTAWQPDGGDYLSTFVSNTGTSAGSSLALLVNQFNQDFELLKNGQIGIPLGKRTLNDPQPGRVEAYYSRRSTELVQAHLQAIHQLYRGISYDGTQDGSSLEDYLVALNPIFDADVPLPEAISAQLVDTEAAVGALPTPLAEGVVNEMELVAAAWDEIQAQVILFKTDMPSALGIIITYQDNDGD